MSMGRPATKIIDVISVYGLTRQALLCKSHHFVKSFIASSTASRLCFYIKATSMTHTLLAVFTHFLKSVIYFAQACRGS